jgi:glycosyltransferase involved in cell wall biosynthesis
MSSEKPTIICLTPIKNEAWILDRFLSCASLWADHILLADENSTDNSVQIAAKYPKARVIKNDSTEYNELYRQNLLLREARKIPGKKLFITLDADEFFTANVLESNEWATMLSAEEGTLISFNWVNINPDFDTCIIDSYPMIWSFMDDGTEHIGHKFHSQRVPFGPDAKLIHCKEIKVLHYAYVHPKRLQSKLYWYKVLETNVNKQSKPKYINHRYASPNFRTSNESIPIKKEWLTAYLNNGIDMTSIRSNMYYFKNPIKNIQVREEVFWWDKEIINWMEVNGVKKYAYLEIWDRDWTSIAHYFNKTDLESFKNPVKLKHKMILKSFKIYYNTKSLLVKRILSLFFRLLGQ